MLSSAPTRHIQGPPDLAASVLTALGQTRHPLFEPLDVLPQCFDLLGLPPLFPVVLHGQLLEVRRQPPFQPGHAEPSLSRQLFGKLTAHNLRRTIQRAGR